MLGNLFCQAHVNADSPTIELPGLKKEINFTEGKFC